MIALYNVWCSIWTHSMRADCSFNFLPQKWHFVRDVLKGVALNTSNQKPKIPFLKLKIKLHARWMLHVKWLTKLDRHFFWKFALAIYQYYKKCSYETVLNQWFISFVFQNRKHDAVDACCQLISTWLNVSLDRHPGTGSKQVCKQANHLSDEVINWYPMFYFQLCLVGYFQSNNFSTCLIY